MRKLNFVFESDSHTLAEPVGTFLFACLYLVFTTYSNVTGREDNKSKS